MAYPNSAGYPQPGYISSPSPYPAGQGSYPYPPQHGQFPPQQGQYSQQGQYPPQHGQHPPQHGQYPPQHGQYPPQQGPYPPQPGPYPAQAGQFSQQGAPQPAPAMGFLKPETAANLEGRVTPTPEEDVPEEGTDATPTAPPIDSMAKLPGYEGLDFTGGGAPPPPPAALPPPPENYGHSITQHEVPSSEQIREVVAGYVAEHCCYGKGPIRDMKIVTVTPTPAMKLTPFDACDRQYTLESMTEMRSTRWQFVPWRGETVAPPTGPPPGPWDMLVTLNPDQWFKNLTSVAEVPNTQTVRVCHDCKGLCETRCTRCHGRGFSRCPFCHGRGRRTMHNDNRNCTSCHGRGSRRCTTCHTAGMVPCPSCEATGNLRCYVELTVKWQSHQDVKVVERTDLPDDLIKTVSGEEVFRAEEQRVHPILGFPDRLVSECSQQLVQKHGKEWPSERIFRQRHVVQSVPVFCVTYHCDGTEGTFFIYGNSQKIYFPDYPKKCCCIVM